MQVFWNRWPWWLAALFGAILPLYFFLPWFIQDTANFFLFGQEAATTAAARTVLADIVWAALVFSVFVVIEVFRTKRFRLLWTLLLTWTIGLSCGLPLYFALR